MATLNLFSPESQQDPYPLYRHLRTEAPIHWSEQLQSWVLSRYPDVLSALQDVRLSAAYTESLFFGLPDELYARFEPMRRAYKTAMIFSDPPEHTRRRTILHKVFTPRFVESLRVRIARTV